MKQTKKIVEDELDSIRDHLLNGNSKKKKSAVRKIGKHSINQLSKELLDTFSNLKKTPRNWEIQSEMIKSLGVLKVTELLPFVQKIIDQNLEDDMITFEASKAWLRINSKNNDEMKANIFHLLNEGGKSVKDGAAAILASENINLNEKEMLLLIDIIDNDKVFDEDLDYRTYLISAMATWPKELSSPIFKKYTGDHRINQTVIAYARKGESCYSDY